MGILIISLETAPSLDDQNRVKILYRMTKIRARDRLVYKEGLESPHLPIFLKVHRI